MKILHVKNGLVAAISFPTESLPDYGTKVEVSVDTVVSVGDAYELPAAPQGSTPEASADAPAPDAKPSKPVKKK